MKEIKPIPITLSNPEKSQSGKETNKLEPWLRKIVSESKRSTLVQPEVQLLKLKLKLNVYH